MALLSEPRSAKESLFVAQIARRAGDLDIAAKVLEGLDAKKFADDIALEHGLLAFARDDVKTMRLRLATYSEEGGRAPEARYFLGISLFHLGEHAQARATWKKLIEQYGEHPFSLSRGLGLHPDHRRRSGSGTLFVHDPGSEEPARTPRLHGAEQPRPHAPFRLTWTLLVEFVRGQASGSTVIVRPGPFAESLLGSTLW